MSDEQPMVSVIVLNYNGAKYLSTLLSSLHRQSSNSFELIVVDNGSTDGSPDGVKSNFNNTQIIFIESENNSSICLP